MPGLKISSSGKGRIKVGWRGDSKLIIWHGSWGAEDRSLQRLTGFSVHCAQACLNECEILIEHGFITHLSGGRGNLGESSEWTLSKKMGLIIGTVLSQYWRRSGQIHFLYQPRTEDTTLARDQNSWTPNSWVVIVAERVKLLAGYWEKLVQQCPNLERNTGQP